MSFININDPAGVSALLEKLRSSQAWADLEAHQPPPSQTHTEPQTAPTQPSTRDTSKHVEKMPSVASLLSQLSSSGSGPSSTPPVQGTSMSSSSSSTSRPSKDVRNLSFQQALPHLAQLSDDTAFVDTVLKLRRDQLNMEKQLWEERQALHDKQAEKVKIAVTKANMLGTGITDREANAMRQVFEEELEKFDRERVVLAWDGLISRQQAALEKLGVPTMFVTDDGSDRERQQRIIQVLEGIVGTGDTDRTS